jgi:hypothetical protein
MKFILNFFSPIGKFGMGNNNTQENNEIPEEKMKELEIEYFQSFTRFFLKK